MKTGNSYIFLLMLLSLGLSSCDFLFGSKEDEVVDEIFEEGSIDPELASEVVGYVPIQPFWSGFSNPVDVFVGYDEMVYVVDDNGVNVLDQAGRNFRIFPVQGATDIVQDRRLHTYVAGRVDIDVDGNGEMENLAAVYHFGNMATSSEPEIIDTLIHPFNDDSRAITAFRGDEDELVEFTGLTTLANNSLYITRKGPNNSVSSIARPDNTVLFHDKDGNNIGYSQGLSATNSNLKSIWEATAISSFAAPPQSLSGISSSPDFLVTLSAPGAQYKTLWIKQYSDPISGITYGENPELLLQDADKADRFLYEPDRFGTPADVCVAPDFTGYIFVVDSELDSLYQFTQKGYEGVNPPATINQESQILVSFGGFGSGPFEFKEPSGVCYFREVVYVADKGNNRIVRYKLSTDIE